MTQTHLNQAEHNSKFIEYLEGNCSGIFGDWKITGLFYCSLHLMRGLVESWGHNHDQAHKPFNYNINPDHKDAKYPVKKEICDAYLDLYFTCKNIRYDGFLYAESIANSMWEIQFVGCKKYLTDIKEYVSKNGITLNF